MAELDLNQKMIDYLIQCPVVRNNPLFFNFAKAKEDNNQFLTLSNNVSVNEPYIDGSVLKQYTFILITYKSISFNPVVKQEGYPDENLLEVAEFQQLIDWVKEQQNNNNLPDFGENCMVDKVYTLSENPVLYDVDESVSPALARYSVTIRVDYLDITDRMWHN